MKKKLFVILFSFIFFLSVSGISDPLKDGDPLSIYPNPASSQLTAIIHLDLSPGSQLKIIDLTGKTVGDFSGDLSYKDVGYIIELDISDLKAGIYFLRLKQQNEVFSKKLIVR